MGDCTDSTNQNDVFIVDLTDSHMQMAITYECIQKMMLPRIWTHPASTSVSSNAYPIAIRVWIRT